MEKIRIIEEQYTKKDLPSFKVGDTIKVMVKIPEQDKVRLHPFEGIVISKKGSGLRSSFTVRRISYGEGVERVFPLYSPSIDKIEVLRKAKTRKARIYYIRKRVGRKATEVEADTSEDLKKK